MAWKHCAARPGNAAVVFAPQTKASHPPHAGSEETNIGLTGRCAAPNKSVIRIGRGRQAEPRQALAIRPLMTDRPVIAGPLRLGTVETGAFDSLILDAVRNAALRLGT